MLRATLALRLFARAPEGALRHLRCGLMATILLLSGQSLTGCGSDDNEITGGDDDAQGARDGGKATTRDAGKDAGKTSLNDKDGGAMRPSPFGDSSSETCAAITKTAPVLRGKVDVIWLVDNSPSMADKIFQLSANIGSFFETIASSGADTRVVTISIADLAAGTPLGADAEKYRFVLANVWSKLLYSTALSSFSQYQEFLRPEASTHFVAVTDDEDFIAAADFKSQMEGLLGHNFTLHAIVAQQFGCGAGVGQQYLSNADATMGEKISICSQDWTQVFGDLQSAVIEAVPLPCSYALAEIASTDAYDPGKVQVVYTPSETTNFNELPKSSSADGCGDQPGWFYDSESDPKQINLCPAACELAKQGGAMDIAFGCMPTVFL